MTCTSDDFFKLLKDSLKIKRRRRRKKQKKKKNEAQPVPPKPVVDPVTRTGLVFPVRQIQHTFPQRLDAEAAVFFSGVIEFLVAEILALAGDDAALQQSNKITIHHIPGLQDRKKYANLLRVPLPKITTNVNAIKKRLPNRPRLRPPRRFFQTPD